MVEVEGARREDDVGLRPGGARSEEAVDGGGRGDAGLEGFGGVRRVDDFGGRSDGGAINPFGKLGVLVGMVAIMDGGVASSAGCSFSCSSKGSFILGFP